MRDESLGVIAARHDHLNCINIFYCNRSGIDYLDYCNAFLAVPYLLSRLIVHSGPMSAPDAWNWVILLEGAFGALAGLEVLERWLLAIVKAMPAML